MRRIAVQYTIKQPYSISRPLGDETAALSQSRMLHRAMPNACTFCVPRRLVFTIAVALLAAMLVHQAAPEASAQAGTTTGIIRGTVRDPLGDPMEGAVVVLQHRETDLRTSVETSSSGTFARTLLPPGTYDLTVKAATDDFSTERIQGARLRVGEMLDLAVTLKIVTAETITVVSELSPTLDNRRRHQLAARS